MMRQHSLPQRRPSPAIISGLLCLAALLHCLGCSGAAELNLTSLDYTAIIPDYPLVLRYPAQECYYYTDQAGRLYLTFRYRNLPLIKMLSQDLQIAIRLEDASPAVNGNYRFIGPALLGVLAAGPQEFRFRSYQGVVAVNVQKDGRLTGGFRVAMLLTGQALLGGWAPGKTFHFVGRFEAVSNRKLGEAIERACVSGPWPRVPSRPLPATWPALPTPRGGSTSRRARSL